MIVKSLRKHHINKPDEVVLGRIARSDRLLDYGAVNTDCAYSVYQDVRSMAGSETKSYIGDVLGLHVNGPVFEQFPFILAAREKVTFAPKLIKVLRIADSASSLTERQEDLRFEVEASKKFKHEAIVPMQHAEVAIDEETARRVHCRNGNNDVLIMPWYTTTLDKLPSGDLLFIAQEGRRLFSALEYLHSQSYVHLDVKAMNVFVDANGHLFLGDFGSCKPVGHRVTSSTFQFYFEDMLFKPANPLFDWFMFLVMLLIETLSDRRQYSTLFYKGGSRFVNYVSVIECAQALASNDIVGDLIGSVLQKVLHTK